VSKIEQLVADLLMI